MRKRRMAAALCAVAPVLGGTAYAAGSDAAGAVNMTAAYALCAALSGALLAAYLSRVTTDDQTYKGTMSVIFTVENAFRIVAYSATGLLTMQSLQNAALLLPFMALGLFLGIRLSSRMNARAMRIIIGVMLLLSGVPLVLAGL